MNFCPHCGAKLALRIPQGDTLLRHVCNSCGAVHYKNPLLVIGAIPEWEDRILLCKRAIEPRLGTWTLPAGFMELGETTGEAAMRETLEEAKARIALTDVFTMLSVPHINQVHIFYRARLLDLDFGPGEESMEVGLFSQSEIPWQEIAFRTVSSTLQYYYEDQGAGAFRLHTGDIPPQKRSGI
jgi:ADP-ribose pyrophosphatase YjhB (NUDIX family)